MLENYRLLFLDRLILEDNITESGMIMDNAGIRARYHEKDEKRKL